MLLSFLIGSLLLCGSNAYGKKRICINKIKARVNGVNLLQSDLEEPRIAKEGNTFTLDEAIKDELLCQHAKEMHMQPTSLDVERQLVAFKAHNNIADLSDEEFEIQLKQGGFSLQAYKNQLARLMAVENIKRAEVSEKTIVSTQEVEEHYKKHPEYTKEAYHLNVVTIPVSAFTTKEAFAQDPSVKWEDHGFIEASDLSDEYVGVKKLLPGQLLNPIKTGEFYDVVKLVAKQDVRLKTLAESYGLIERKIQNKRRTSIVTKLEDRLVKKATIVILEEK